MKREDEKVRGIEGLQLMDKRFQNTIDLKLQDMLWFLFRYSMPMCATMCLDNVSYGAFGKVTMFSGPSVFSSTQGSNDTVAINCKLFAISQNSWLRPTMANWINQL